MSPKVINDAEKACKQFYPVIYGFKRWKVYWYSAENGTTVFGVAHFYNNLKELIKIPITAWTSDNAGSYVNIIVYDALHPTPPYPIYRLFEAKCMPRTPNYALICDNEKTVDYIVKEHGWLASLVPITTYSGIAGTDWEVLKPRIPIIYRGAQNGWVETVQALNKMITMTVTIPPLCARAFVRKSFSLLTANGLVALILLGAHQSHKVFSASGKNNIQACWGQCSGLYRE